MSDMNSAQQIASALSSFVANLGFEPDLVVDLMSRQEGEFHRDYALINLRLAIEQELQRGMTSVVGRVPEGLSQAGFDHYAAMLKGLTKAQGNSVHGL